MARSTDHVRLSAGVLLLLGAAAAPAGAQISGSLFERLNLDRLKLTAIGASYGAINPSAMEATQSYSIFADYGEVVEKWRVVFSATYWDSRFDDDVVREFTDKFREAIIDPAADDTLREADIAVSDIAVVADLRFAPLRARMFRPYIGGGFGFHVLNAEGRYISNTLVEQSLDNIAAGFAGVVGLDAVLFRRVTAGVQVRYDLLSGTRYGSLRVTGSYLFDRTPVVR